jgi:hypothetical protein
VDHTGRIILHGAQADEALAFARLSGIGNRELLKIRIEARLGVALENASFNPIPQQSAPVSLGNRWPKIRRTRLYGLSER